MLSAELLVQICLTSARYICALKPVNAACGTLNVVWSATWQQIRMHEIGTRQQIRIFTNTY